MKPFSVVANPSHAAKCCKIENLANRYETGKAAGPILGILN
jgi:hypothetical protein